MSTRQPLLLFVLVLVFSMPSLHAFGADGSDETAGRLVEAASLHEAGELDAAASLFAKVLETEPHNTYAACQLGLIRLKQESRAEAASLLDGVLAREPDNVFALVWRGVLHLDDGDEQAAREAFSRVLAVEPQDADAHYFLGVLEAAAGNRAAAVAHFREAQAAGEQWDDPEIHYRLGRAFMAEDMAASARFEFERCLAIAPDHLDALDALGWLYFNEGYEEEAIEAWHRGLDLSPQDAQLRANLATVFGSKALELMEAGSVDRAVLHWRKAQRFEPDNRAAAFYLRRLVEQRHASRED
jgi:tetratricopeptide (TPR) repeat protein